MEEIKKKKNKDNNMASMMSTSTTTSSPDQNQEQPITAWKLYQNPFYNSHQNPHHRQDQTAQSQRESQAIEAKNVLQCLQLPLSARKLAASFWDLAFFRHPSAAAASVMAEDELESARAEIAGLRAELEAERRSRRKLEAANKRLAREAGEERRARESAERMCEEIAREASADKAEIARMKREIDEERKMMRMSEVLREERVQMKLADAKIALEEKLSELDAQLGFRKTRQTASGFPGKFRQFVMGERFSSPPPPPPPPPSDDIDHDKNVIRSVSDRDYYRSNSSNSGFMTFNNSDHILAGGGGISTTSLPVFQRKSASPETENPHIKRGIKGFVEFPRVVRAIGAKNRHWVTKLECQKAQLRILLKQKSPIRSSNNNNNNHHLITS